VPAHWAFGASKFCRACDRQQPAGVCNLLETMSCPACDYWRALVPQLAMPCPRCGKKVRPQAKGGDGWTAAYTHRHGDDTVTWSQPVDAPPYLPQAV
jgi:hypothetical protein